jgi:hypothetical protein
MALFTWMVVRSPRRGREPIEEGTEGLRDQECLTIHRIRRLPQARLVRSTSRAFVVADNFNVWSNMSQQSEASDLIPDHPPLMRTWYHEKYNRASA